MWSCTYSRVVRAEAAEVWRCWEDVARWHAWNADVARATLDGPFAAGSTVTMRLADGTDIPLVLADVEPGSRFVDEARMGGLVLRTSHVAEPLPEGTRVTYALEVTGPDAAESGEAVGRAVSADFPEVLEALAAHVEARVPR